ncbi:hypothetical protein V8F33_009186 [Rhypophila sp. PSN 637]
MDLELLGLASRSLVDELWGSTLSTNKRLFNGDMASDLTHDAYCEYFQHQWQLVAGNADGRYVALKTVESMTQLIKDLSTNTASERNNIIAAWKSKPALAHHSSPSPESWNNSVDLAARLLLMLKVGVVTHQKVPRHCLSWKSASLRDFVHSHFNISPVLHDDHVRLPKTFDSWAISVIAGIEIDFTANLADHLLLVEDDSKLLIFHHFSFLECQKDEGHPSSTPATTASGTTPSRNNNDHYGFPRCGHSTNPALRHPQTHKQKWLTNLLLSKSTAAESYQTIDTRLTRCGSLQAEDRQIERFYFWRDRLVILKQAYDDATPSTLRQWWCDRRNGVQWYTFWVAILVLIITTLASRVQCVEGALQVYKAYEPRVCIILVRSKYKRSLRAVELAKPVQPGSAPFSSVQLYSASTSRTAPQCTGLWVLGVTTISPLKGFVREDYGPSYPR